MCYNHQDETLPIISVFKYFLLYSNGLNSQCFRYSFHFPGHDLEARMRENTELTSAGEWLTLWRSWSVLGVAVSRCGSPHTDLPFIHMHELVNYEHHLSLMANRYCRLLDEGSIAKANITPHTDLYCIVFFSWNPVHASLAVLEDSFGLQDECS